VVDESKLIERVGGDRRALAEIVRIFRADSPRQLARLRKAIRAANAEALRAAAHALKGAVSNFAADRATGAALRLQQLGERGELGAAAQALEQLEGELSALDSALRALVPGASRRRRTPPRHVAAKPRRALAKPRRRRAP
jgi:HPt (histidine-containing phosphotransfer) domain-containing protein